MANIAALSQYLHKVCMHYIDIFEQDCNHEMVVIYVRQRWQVVDGRQSLMTAAFNGRV